MMTDEELYNFDNGTCSKTVVGGLKEALEGCKLPYALDPDGVNSELTKTAVTLAQTGKGEGHDQYLTGITVWFNLNFSCKAWVEAERYKYLCFVSSMSTMHRATKLDVEKQCNEYVLKSSIALAETLKDDYEREKTPENKLRLLYNLPMGYQLTAKMVTNYRELKTIYAQRKNHELPEWHRFCEWVEQLPMAELLITGTKKWEDIGHDE